MGTVKTHRYEVRTHWLGGRQLTLEAPGKTAITVATPPDFKDGVPGVWSPEELLVGSLATCFELTLVAIADYRGVPISALEVDAKGYLERKDDRYQFLVIEVDAKLATDPEHEHEAGEIAALAKERCIVGVALSTPVVLSAEVRTSDAAAVSAA
jgi:organic hydroperoxide reductase OsmC/OhrA